MIVLNQDEQILYHRSSEFLMYQWEWWISDSNFQAKVPEKKLKNLALYVWNLRIDNSALTQYMPFSPIR